MHIPREAALLLNRTLRPLSFFGEPVEASVYLPAKLDESNSKCNCGPVAGSADVHCRFGSVSCVPVDGTLAAKFACELKALIRQCRRKMGHTPEQGSSRKRANG